MTDSLRGVRTRPASTHKPYARNPVSTPARSDMVKNNDGGGYVFKIDDMDRARRFLVLGSEGTFYRSGQEMSTQNAKTIIGLASDVRTSKPLVDLIVEISTEGRAPKQNPALFALAIAASHGDDESKRYALSKLPEVARTGTALFLFAGYVEQFRGWGRALKRAVAEWYTEKSVDSLAYQAAKYKSREGYSHRDLFRLAHPVSEDPAFKGLGEWILRGNAGEAPALIQGMVEAHKPGADVPALVRQYGLSWEMLPTEALNSTDVWDALLEKSVPLGALLRQLPRLTRLGMLPAIGGHTASVVARLNDVEELRRARIHPINLLVAHKTYASGRSDRGTSSWTPNQKIVDALNDAFYLAFKTVEPTGKNTLIGVDVSGSMTMNGYYGYGPKPTTPLTPAEVAAAMALVTLNVEKNAAVYGFATSLVELPISPRMRLRDVLNETSKRAFGSTNPGALIEKALKDNIPVETFIVITDNEVNTGRHVFQLLEKYRKQTGIPARMIVLGVTASDFSIADPNDPLSLDLAGFDSATPSLIADFSRGF